MGSPDFALPVLKALTRHYDVAGVVTQPDRAAGRGRGLKSPPVKTLALELGLPVIQPEKLKQPEAMQQLRVWADPQKGCALSAALWLHQRACIVVAALARRGADQCRVIAWG